MNIKFMNQPKDITLEDILKTKLENKYDEVFIISGIAKDSGIELLLESIENAINAGGKININLGIDRKNTSKDILLKLLKMGANLKVHVNSEENKVETRIYIFESKEKDSYIYISGGKFSEGGLAKNNCLITEITYTPEETEKYKLLKNQVLLGIDGVFKDVDEEDIILLANKGEIVSRIIERKIPSISELYGNKEATLGEQIYDEGTGLGLLNKEELEDVDIEFDLGIDIRKNVKLEAEKEEELIVVNKTEEDLNRLLGKTTEENTKKSRIIKDLTDDDFKNMTTLILEAGKISTVGVNANEIKIPKSLALQINEFLNVEVSPKIKLEVLDNKDNREYKIENVEMLENDKGISIKSEKLTNLDIGEKDLIRIIKINSEKYKLEIIREETKEYDVWERYCTNSIKGTKRRYGII